MLGANVMFTPLLYSVNSRWIVLFILIKGFESLLSFDVTFIILLIYVNFVIVHDIFS